MKSWTKLAVIGVSAVTLAGAGTGIAVASSSGDDDAASKPITGPALQEASAAALAETGGGKVTATELGDEEGYYEIEVTLADGSQVDVHLDRNLKVLDAKADAPDGNEGEHQD
jgi:uncharacterized membrane protein YkoI